MSLRSSGLLLRGPGFQCGLGQLPETAIFAAESDATGTAASIELSAPLRYTGSRLRPGDQGLPGPFTRLLKPPQIISNISKA